MKKIIFLMLLVFVFLFTACPQTQEPQDNSIFTITSSYQDVNWDSFGQFKGALHVHTTNSDGNQTLANVINAHYQAAPAAGIGARNFDILAITDHNYGNSSTGPWSQTPHWVAELGGRNGLNQTRFDQIRTGNNRDGRGMLMIPNSSEIAVYPDEINIWWTNFDWNASVPDGQETILAKVQELGGFAMVNHPGRTTGGDSQTGTAGVIASNNQSHINRYKGYFVDFSRCLGFEILNRRDQDSASDRILWDNVNALLFPQEGRFAWGFAGDDSHSDNGIGINNNMFLMPSNTEANLKEAMEKGRFYLTTAIARRELGNNFVGFGPLPVITNIMVDNYNDKIRIEANYATKVEWITSDGADPDAPTVNPTRVFATGNTINLADYKDDIGPFVRANVTGPGGIAFTQPFGVTLK